MLYGTWYPPGLCVPPGPPFRTWLVQGWKFLTLSEGYGVSEATWEPMSAFIQPKGGINPVFRSYLVDSNVGQLLTRAETSVPA